MERECVQKCLELLRRYDWLLDANVLDFYVEDHWSKLPPAWRRNLDDVPPQLLHELLDNETSTTCRRVWPLELLALRRLLSALCINRRPQQQNENFPPLKLLEHPKLKQIFTKCVKPKKRHEVQRMAHICQRSCADTNVDFVVDFGAGLGHLARVLGYGCGIAVCCLEMRAELNRQAAVIDQQLEASAARHMSSLETTAFRRPTHLTLCLSADMTPQQFLSTLKTALQLTRDDFRFGIVGLHACGDLGAILMRLFLSCAQARFLHFVGCCYMKLSTAHEAASGAAAPPGYPLSAYLQRQPHSLTRLSYEAREISCHASETYCARLCAGDYEHLRVHSFRAAAERILRAHYPEMRRCGLRSVKHTPGLQFSDYFYKAVQGLLPPPGLPLPALQTPATHADLLHWRRIVVFYTLRLMLAPLVESAILYDRQLFLRENAGDCHVQIQAVFEPRLSPRNHITSARKPNS